MSNIEKRLKDLNIELLDLPSPSGNFSSYTKTGNLIFMSGQGSIYDEKTSYKGAATNDSNIEHLQKAGELCCIKILSQLKKALDGDLERIVKCVELKIFISCKYSFGNIFTVADGCSNLMVKILGEEKGKHSRHTAGVSDLPRGATVNVASIFEIR